jgi:hypothetical protein
MGYKTIAAFSLAVPVSIVLGVSLVTGAFIATRNWPWRDLPTWSVFALNYLPPFLAGTLTAGLVVSVVRRWGAYVATLPAHVRRNGLAYAICIAIAVLIVMNRSNGDYGLWRQLVEWPLAAILGLMSADLTFTLIKRRANAADPEAL